MNETEQGKVVLKVNDYLYVVNDRDYFSVLKVSIDTEVNVKSFLKSDDPVLMARFLVKEQTLGKEITTDEFINLLSEMVDKINRLLRS